MVSELTLVDRALARLRGGPAAAAEFCAEVLGLMGAPRAVAERVAIAVLGADPRVRQLPDGRWAMLAEAQGSPHIEECAFAVIDLETTGMRARGDDRITEVAVVLVHGERREVVFQSLVNPGRPIPSMISMVTGITNDMVAHAPPFEAIADELLGILAGRIFVAHNARFDWGFLDASFRRTRGLALTGPRLCTVRLARRLLRDVGSCGLDNLTLHFGFENPARHRALGDAEVTAQLLERLLSLARGEGARTLTDLEQIQLRRRRPEEPGTGNREAAAERSYCSRSLFPLYVAAMPLSRHPFKVGQLRCHTLEAGLQRLDGGAMFGVVPKPLWERADCAGRAEPHSARDAVPPGRASRWAGARRYRGGQQGRRQVPRTSTASRTRVRAAPPSWRMRWPRRGSPRVT